MAPAVDVICAYPLSGQYGPGQRIGMYILLLGCIFGRRYQLLLDVSLSAFLIVGAVSATHLVVLQIARISGGTKPVFDLDLIGATYFCMLATVTSPSIISHSRTYMRAASNGLIFIWATFITGATIGAITTFVKLSNDDFVTNAFACVDAQGHNITIADYTAGQTDCHLSCMDIHLPLRQAQSAVYLPATNVIIPLFTATLSAIVTYPSLLLLKGRPVMENFDRDNTELFYRLFTGIGMYLVPLAMCILVGLGEKLFWDFETVGYGVESMAAVGQWSSVVSLAFALIGGGYFILWPNQDIDSARNFIEGDTEMMLANDHER